MKKYKDKGKVKIKAQHLTAEQVRALGYEDTAALCDVVLGPGKSSPPDFFYEHIRRDLANEVEAEGKQALKDLRRAKLQAKIDGDPDFAGMTVVEDAEGNLEIK